MVEVVSVQAEVVHNHVHLHAARKHTVPRTELLRPELRCDLHLLHFPGEYLLEHRQRLMHHVQVTDSLMQVPAQAHSAYFALEGVRVLLDGREELLVQRGQVAQSGEWVALFGQGQLEHMVQHARLLADNVLEPVRADPHQFLQMRYLHAHALLSALCDHPLVLLLELCLRDLVVQGEHALQHPGHLALLGTHFVQLAHQTRLLLVTHRRLQLHHWLARVLVHVHQRDQRLFFLILLVNAQLRGRFRLGMLVSI